MPGISPLRSVPAAAGALLSLVLPSAALAQTTGSCGQTAALTESLDAPLAPGFEAIRRFVQIRRNEPRYIEFQLDGPQGVTIRTEAPAIDPALALYDRSGLLVGWDDDGGGGVDALLAVDLEAGGYCMQVRPIGASPTDFAEIVVVFESGLVLPPGQEAPCSTDATLDLAHGLVAPVEPLALDAGTEPGTGRRDYRLSLAESLGFRIDLASAEFDTVLEVFDASGAQVAYNDDHSGTDSRIETVLAPGDYCVVARSFGGEDGGFTMAVSEADIAPVALPCGDADRTGLLAEGFGASSSAGVSSEIAPDLLLSWFSLNVAETVEIRLDARSSSLDTVLELHDASGALVAENDDGPDGTDSRIDAALEPGDYCVTVRGFGDSTGPFHLTAVPAGMEPPLPEVETPDPATASSVEDMGVLGDVVRSYTIGGDSTLWASFALETPASVTVNGMSVSSDFSVALFAEDGTLVGEAGPVAALSPADVAGDLAPGTYLVALTNHGASGTILRQITVTRN
jgi:hypothetical protein